MAATDNLLQALQVLASAGVDVSALKIPGSVAGLASRAVGAEGTIDAIKERATAAQGLEALKGEQERLTLQARAQAKMMTNQAIGELVERIQPAAAGATNTTAFLADLEKLRSLPGGDVAAKGIETIVEQNLERATQGELERMRKTLGPDFSQIDEKAAFDRIKTTLQRGGTVDALIDEESRRVSGVKAEQDARQTLRAKLVKVGAISEKPTRMTPEQMVETVLKLPAAEQGAAIESMGKGARRGRMVKGGIMGGLAGAAIAAAIAKMAGGGEKAAIPPEIQMALMSRMQQGRGGAGQDPQVADGRSLLNMSRALGIVKAVQDMAGLSAAAPSPARLV
jgi:hypothetical protein